jgi:ribosomal protein S18 acetylase RimI-like enzyme
MRQAEEMTFRIRDAEPADTNALKVLFRRASLSNEDDRTNLLANPDALELSDIPADKGHRRVATLEDGRIAGFATALIQGDFVELDDLFVDPECMGRGIGRALIRDAIAIARSQGLGRIEVTANHQAVGFYEKAGFVYDRDVETRFGPAPRMHLDVVP